MGLSPDQRALLQAIVSSPDDDLPRLVYADWLEENGQETQGRFIRDSIALARADNHPAENARLQEMAERHGEKWLADLGIESATPGFARGMPERLRYPLHYYFFADAEAGVFDVVPVRSLSIEAEKDFGIEYEDVRKFAEMPLLARLHTLELEGSNRVWAYAEHDPEAWPAFFRSPHLAGLRTLALTNCLGEDDFMALTDSPQSSGLRTLAMRGWGSGTNALLAVIRSPHLAALTDFWLSHYRFDGEPDDERAVLEELSARFGAGFHPNGYPPIVPALAGRSSADA